FAACFLTCSLCLASASRACRCDALVSGTLSQLNGSLTIITVTLAPTDFANDNPFVTACSANSDPSVGMRICRYMLHLSIARTIASDIRTVRAFLEQNQFTRQSCRRSMPGLSGQFKKVRLSTTVAGMLRGVTKTRAVARQPPRSLLRMLPPLAQNTSPTPISEPPATTPDAT